MQIHPDDARCTRHWLWLAVAVLVIAGSFSLLLVFARMPPFDSWVSDPGFFRRCLVVHVQLALVAWFHAFGAGLLMTLPANRFASWLAPSAPIIAALGVLLLCGSAFATGADPVLCNYIPVVDHPLAMAALALFAVGVLMAVASRQLLPSKAHAVDLACVAAHPALRASAIALVLAILTLLGTLPSVPREVAPKVAYESLFWGVGHVLQLASVASMLAVWLWMTHRATGGFALSRQWTQRLMAVLLLPWLVAPLLPLAGPWSATYRVGFTRLMQFAIAPVVLVVLVACWRQLRRFAWRWDVPRIGFVASSGLTMLGFVLGALIRDANTMIPAHYHANIGAVTAAFMAAGTLLLPVLALEFRSARLNRWMRWQPAAFGVGQAVFAVGFALAGSQGMARKVYGQEQAARTFLETTGLVTMGLGGCIAIGAGILFLTAHVRAAWLHRACPPLSHSRSPAPQAEAANVPWSI